MLIMESENNPLSGPTSRSDLVDILLFWLSGNRIWETFELTDREIVVNGTSAVLTGILQEQYDNIDQDTAYVCSTDIEITCTKGASGWRISGLSFSAQSRAEIDSIATIINTLADAFIQAVLDEDIDALKSDAYFTSTVTFLDDSSDKLQLMQRAALVDALVEMWQLGKGTRAYNNVEINNRAVNITSADVADLLGDLGMWYDDVASGAVCVDSAEIGLFFVKGASGWRISGLNLLNMVHNEL
ncbi:MAG: hypothetical protein WAQ71_08330 [Limnochordia bacterium]|nr:hypothetical protein [Limnochordia bacterium]HQD70041.1 hypothetical protein [Limnochordia bacterium]